MAVVGRQNVGKSTLVNRLFGRRETIAAPVARRHARPGRGRGRLAGPALRSRRHRRVPRTAPAGIEALVAEQADRAAAEADLIILVVDAQAGVTEEDAMLARRLRRATVPVVLVANKVDSDREDADAAAFHRLGLGEPVAVSALHGRASGDLLDRIVALLPDAPAEADDAQPSRASRSSAGPTSGKSSLFNRLVGDGAQRRVRGGGDDPRLRGRAGDWPDGPVRFVDTAGMRRAIAVQGVEYYSFVRAGRAIERADVAVARVRRRRGVHGRGQARSPCASSRPAARCSSSRTSGTWSRRRTARTSG